MTAWHKYLLVHAADWLLLACLGWVAIRWFGVPWWPPVLLLAAWVLKDLALFPSSRRYYETEPAETRIVGEEGEALSPVAASGWARVHGEIWRVRVAPGELEIPKGRRVRVSGIDGLTLIVGPSAQDGRAD